MRTRPTVPLPQNSEELRIRLGILGSAWVMCGMSQTRNPLLADFSPDLFAEYADYLLGEHVWASPPMRRTAPWWALHRWPSCFPTKWRFARRPTA